MLNLNTLFHLIPPALRWRLGRALYMDARGDFPNDMACNGELFLQRCIVDTCLDGQNSEGTLVAFDVGANRGDWTASLLAYLDLTKPAAAGVSIVAFEPDPTGWEHCRTRFERNTRVKVEQIAISSRAGKANFFRGGPAVGTNSLHYLGDPHADVIEVKTETLADYCSREGIRRVELAKVDTEGHDCEVILGAKKLLITGSISILQFEYNYRWVFARRFLRDVFDAISGLPYRLGKLQPNHVVLFEKWHFELERFFEGNYVLIHEGAIHRVPLRRAVWDKSNTMGLARE